VDSAGGDTIADMIQTDVGGSHGLANSAEMLMLFKWDGVSTNGVIDVDYIIWGSTESVRMTRSSVTINTHSYVDDTAPASQVAQGAPGSGFSAQRCVETEGTETGTGSNGVGGDDETSENLSSNFANSSTRSPGAVVAPGVCP